MSDRFHSRRALLRYCGVGAAAGLAGCLWGNGEDDGEETDETPTEEPQQPTSTPTPSNETEDLGAQDYVDAFELAGEGAEPFEDWVVPGNPQGKVGNATGVCSYLDFEAGENKQADQLTQRRSEVANAYNTQPASLAGELIVGEPGGAGRRLIHLGEFDAEAMVEGFQQSEDFSQVDEYRGYTVFEQEDGNRIVVGPDAIVRVPIYEQYIDASKGDGERLMAVDEGVRYLFSVLPVGLQISVSRHENIEDLEINGSAWQEFDEEGTPSKTTRAFVFHDREDATVERAREIISIGSTDYEEILTEEQHGRMVMTEFIADWGSGDQ